MAGDWMKIELELPDKPEVHYIANVLQMDPDMVVGKLIRVWQWFDKHTTNGDALGVTFALLDRIVQRDGFAEAMQFAGWLEQRDMVLRMPKFDRHTSKSAKKRALTTARTLRYRDAKSVTNVTQLSCTREEKRRSTPIPPNGGGGFEDFWKAYPRHDAKPDAIKAWTKLHPDSSLVAEILRAIAAALTSEQWQRDKGQYIPQPARWLNGRKWEDQGVESKGGGGLAL